MFCKFFSRKMRLTYFLECYCILGPDLNYREALMLPVKANPEVIIDTRNDSQRIHFSAFRNPGDQGQISPPPLQTSPSYGDNERNNNGNR